MNDSLFGFPSAFSSNPLLCLLPSRGHVAKLESLTSSLFARYETVTSLQREMKSAQERDLQRAYAAEEAMLRQVLDWLDLKPESGERQ